MATASGGAGKSAARAAAPLRVAVVGVGHLGRHHARLMAEVPGAELVAVVDSRLEQARAVAGPLDVLALASADELPADVAAVSVAVPTSAHHAVACPLLERGMHVLVEKPMAATLEQARGMAALARDRGLVLQVGHVERFNPALSVVRELGVKPRFIEANRLAPFTYRALDTSVVMDLMIHDIDIVLELAGSPLKRLEAVGSHVLGRLPDIANARLTFENGCVANITASRVSFEPLRRTKVFADDAFLSLDFANRRAFVVRMAEGFDKGSLGPEAAARFPPKGSFKEFVQQGLLNLREIDMEETNPLLSELTAFVAAVRVARGQPAAAAGAGPPGSGLP
ncbi:MAG TPA: Gfo/Idh/MocA family oxidoreductase, partial [Planctomycetota bacterium]|nr:Gfo/Idh/MocA family oxidoreductase [Planctomycetota bacterium]